MAVLDLRQLDRRHRLPVRKRGWPVSIIRFLAAHLRRMPASWADYWSEGIRTPRYFLLERAHTVAGWWVFVLAAVGAGTLGGISLPSWAMAAAVVLVVPGVVLDAVAFHAHLLWSVGLAWQDITCPCCSGPAGGWFDDGQDDGPDDPEDHGLTPEDLRLLDLISSGVVSSGPTTQEMS